ncbi:hypothetical protein H257_16359 [Aphanomyces astaci]|uniref:Uncharacterized protein n=1 Tax=Aphanomyces astaci TaxID=112090 RepID=W4FJ26_APHAT|nr:hypothetical protein H257_16359 [Aphanomyces astaci]ETV67507.1 hypothetical protein H257_16359 [Aphanomyces astaci]RQM22289.1 hypothetical protein B5M09_008931 [Aphanomyces astaci]|eukprot:XP_009843066.1 hypothetical protein H257_16359 [Aphanomyces astaci]
MSELPSVMNPDAAIDDPQTTVLLRMRVQGVCVGYCLPTGEFIFATKGSPKFFVPGGGDEASTLYGESLLSFLSSLDIQRYWQYMNDVQTHLHFLDCSNKDKSMDIRPILANIEGTHTTILLEAISAPLTLRLQRCIDAVQNVEPTRRFSDESTFVIDDDDYQSVIANGALQVSVHRMESVTCASSWTERDSEASLADFAFDLQDDWGRPMVELDDLPYHFDTSAGISFDLSSPVATSQV